MLYSRDPYLTRYPSASLQSSWTKRSAGYLQVRTHSSSRSLQMWQMMETTRYRFSPRLCSSSEISRPHRSALRLSTAITSQTSKASSLIKVTIGSLSVKLQISGTTWTPRILCLPAHSLLVTSNWMPSLVRFATPASPFTSCVLSKVLSYPCPTKPSSSTRNAWTRCMSKPQTSTITFNRTKHELLTSQVPTRWSSTTPSKNQWRHGLQKIEQLPVLVAAKAVWLALSWTEAGQVLQLSNKRSSPHSKPSKAQGYLLVAVLRLKAILTRWTTKRWP